MIVSLILKGVGVVLNLGFKKLEVLYEDNGPQNGTVIMQPLERGYATTLGNDLRRVLLSSMPGASSIGLKVEGLNHEFQRVEGAAEDVAELIMNLKEMRFKVFGEDMQTIKFSAKKEGIYKASDFSLPSEVECLTPEVEFIKLTGEKEIYIEVFLKNGRGYVNAKEHKEFDDFPEIIKVDGLFAPIKKVSVKVEKTRVGQDTNFEKLLLNVETDGSINPKDSVMLASEIIRSKLSFVEDISDVKDEYDLYEQEKEKEKKIFEQDIEILDLGVRPYNCLTKAGYTTIGKVLTLTRSQLEAIDQLGLKSIDEIIEKVRLLGYELKDE